MAEPARQSLSFVAHVVESVREFAMLFGRKLLRIVGGLVYLLPLNVPKPRLDVASQNDDEHRFVRSTRVDATPIALLIEFVFCAERSCVGPHP